MLHVNVALDRIRSHCSTLAQFSRARAQSNWVQFCDSSFSSPLLALWPASEQADELRSAITFCCWLAGAHLSARLELRLELERAASAATNWLGASGAFSCTSGGANKSRRGTRRGRIMSSLEGLLECASSRWLRSRRAEADQWAKYDYDLDYAFKLAPNSSAGRWNWTGACMRI